MKWMKNWILVAAALSAGAAQAQILIGQTVDTNSGWIGGELALIGIRTARAECLRQSGCYQLALPAYDTALVLDGEQLYALAGKAECLRMLGRPQEALHWFDRSLAVHP